MYILEVAEHFCPLYSNAPLMVQFTTVSEREREREREREMYKIDDMKGTACLSDLPTSAVG